MKLIFISDNGSYHRKFNLNGWSIAALLFLFSSTLIIALFAAFKPLKKDIISKNEIQLLNKFDSMLLKTAKLEGQVKRLNSLGKIIAAKSNIDINAYILSRGPAMGGIDDSFSSSVITQASLAKSINDLELELELAEQQYEVLKMAQSSSESINRTQIAEPASTTFSYTTPVATGYISSAFGKRRDPINGHQRHHNGIDIAAKHGSKIHTIASGFVTFSGRKGGYGNIIDIHHSDSLKSRYAHLDMIKVKKGEVVRKGDIIATMGQTGRATGSHLHLEVWEKNRPVNPESYIDTALIK